MENVNSTSETSVNPMESHSKIQPSSGSGDDSENLVQGAVDIVDFYTTTKNDERKLSDASEACQPPVRPTRKFSECSMTDQRRISETSESLPLKPSRKSSQVSLNNRKLSACSESSAVRTPKKVSFSDELPFGVINESSNDGNENVVDQTIQLTSAYLQSLAKVAENTGASSTESDDEETVSSNASASEHELNLGDLFPNSRKVSTQSTRSLATVSSMSLPKSASFDCAATSPAPIVDTFLEQERRNSTCSAKSNSFLVLVKSSENEDVQKKNRLFSLLLLLSFFVLQLQVFNYLSEIKPMKCSRH